MLSWDSEDEIWSRFVLKLVIWPTEVTLVSRTQPLCLWQCYIINVHRGKIKCSSIFSTFGLKVFREDANILFLRIMSPILGPILQSVFDQLWKSFCKKSIFFNFHFLTFLPICHTWYFCNSNCFCLTVKVCHRVFFQTCLSHRTRQQDRRRHQIHKQKTTHGAASGIIWLV